MDKQIEEMARIILNGCCVKLPCEDCKYEICDGDVCMHMLEAEHLYNAGYRKASEVALETVDNFQRELRHIFLVMCGGNDYNTLNLLQIDSAIEALYDTFIAELKKKYTEEGK